MPVSADVSSLRRTDEPWLVVVDEENRPLGWVAPKDLPESGTAADVKLGPYGTFVKGGDSLRGALDATLLSPSGHAIASAVSVPSETLVMVSPVPGSWPWVCSAICEYAGTASTPGRLSSACALDVKA